METINNEKYNLYFLRGMHSIIEKIDTICFFHIETGDCLNNFY